MRGIANNLADAFSPWSERAGLREHAVSRARALLGRTNSRTPANFRVNRGAACTTYRTQPGASVSWQTRPAMRYKTKDGAGPRQLEDPIMVASRSLSSRPIANCCGVVLVIRSTQSAPHNGSFWTNARGLARDCGPGSSIDDENEWKLSAARHLNHDFHRKQDRNLLRTNRLMRKVAPTT